MKILNPQTDSTTIYCFDQVWLNANTHKVTIESCKKMKEAKEALDVKASLEHIIAESEKKLLAAIEEKLDMTERLQQLEEKLQGQLEQQLEHFQSSLTQKVEAALKAQPETQKRDRSRSVRLNVPNGNSEKPQEEEKETPKNNRGWEKPKPRGRGRSRGRSRSRHRSNAKKIIIRPPSTETKEKIDTKYAQKKSIAAILIVKEKSTTKETVEEWFKTSTTPGFDKNKVVVVAMAANRNEFPRFKVLLTDFPIQNLSFNQIWNSFQIPLFVEIVEWRGDPTSSAKATKQRLAWYVGNLNNNTDFTEKLKERAKEVYKGENDQITVVKMPRPRILEEGEIQRTASYCVALQRTLAADSMDDGAAAPGALQDLFTEHIKAKSALIKVFQWKGRPMLPGQMRGQNRNPVEEI